MTKYIHIITDIAPDNTERAVYPPQCVISQENKVFGETADVSMIFPKILCLY